MVSHKYSFELKNDLSELETLCQHLNKFGQTSGLSEACITDINICLDELFTNIISYGFDDDCEHIIKVTMTPEKKGLCLSIEDDGKPFNPVEFKTPDVSCSIEECKIGGLGIHIIRKLMDDICYERCKNKNVLKLKKGIAKSKC